VEIDAEIRNPPLGELLFDEARREGLGRLVDAAVSRLVANLDRGWVSCFLGVGDAEASRELRVERHRWETTRLATGGAPAVVDVPCRRIILYATPSRAAGETLSLKGEEV